MSRTARFLAGWVALMLCASMTMAQGFSPPGRHGRGGGQALRMAEELQLSQSQRDEIRAIFQRYREGALGESERILREARGALEQVIHDPSVDEAAVATAARRVAEQAEQAALARHRMAVEVHGLLDEEQRARAAELREQRGAMERRSRRGPRERFDPAG